MSARKRFERLKITASSTPAEHGSEKVNVFSINIRSYLNKFPASF